VQAEVEAVDLMTRLSEQYAARVHIVHVSSEEATRQIKAARERGVRVSAETCPHYLTFASEEIPDGAAAFKCAPPIRSATQREALWDALKSGALDIVVSDHSASPPALKTGTDLMAVWGGIASLQLGLSIVWTGARQRGLQLDHVVSWMAARPAALVRLARKGCIAPGCDADLVVFEPDASWTVDASQLQHRHPATPYHGLTLAGRVRTTYLRGEMIYDNGTFAARPSGQLLARVGT
jgi:allantoinase